MLNLIKKKIIGIIIRHQVDYPIKVKKKKTINLKKRTKFLINSFGKKNPSKFFYVIKVDKYGGGGLFSNVLFVLNHLKISRKHNFIPVIDMENFPTRYNENKKVLNSFNSWEYYFEPISKITLNEVYLSKNVIFTNDFFNEDMSLDLATDKDLQLIFNKSIKIKKKYIENINRFTKKNFEGHKVLAVHFRGTSMKTFPKHPLPPTYYQIKGLIDEAIKKYKFDKIFLVTDQLDYLNLLKKDYGKMLCYRNSYRSNKAKIFDINPRKLHRYNMGVDALEDTLLMSKLDYLICSRSNMSRVALILKKNMNVIEVWNGCNPNKILVSQFNWIIKKYIPEFMGGFKKTINFKFIKKKSL